MTAFEHFHLPEYLRYPMVGNLLRSALGRDMFEPNYSLPVDHPA